MPETIDKTPEVIAAGFKFPEDPRWRQGYLYFSDMLDHRVRKIDPYGNVSQVTMIEDMPSGLGFMANGDMLIVAMKSAQLYRLADKTLHRYADLSKFAPGGINDMAVDSDGRAYVVQFGSDDWAKAIPSPLLIVQPDGRVEEGPPDILIGNGIRVSANGGRVYVAESAANRLSIFDRATDGSLSMRRKVQLPVDHHPDGICLDDAGGIWVACLSRGIIRINEQGAVTHVLRLPEGRSAYACMFGGQDLRTLYLCVADCDADLAPKENLRTGAILSIEDMEFTGVSVD